MKQSSSANLLTACIANSLIFVLSIKPDFPCDNKPSFCLFLCFELICLVRPPTDLKDLLHETHAEDVIFIFSWLSVKAALISLPKRSFLILLWSNSKLSLNHCFLHIVRHVKYFLHFAQAVMAVSTYSTTNNRFMLSGPRASRLFFSYDYGISNTLIIQQML